MISCPVFILTKNNMDAYPYICPSGAVLLGLTTIPAPPIDPSGVDPV